jgi:uncharacterized repeat protein (TIGR03803 family)
MKAVGIGMIAGAVCCALTPQLAAAGKEKVLYSFCPDGRSQCPDGNNPSGNLTAVNGMLYGTTAGGGQGDGGLIFSLNPNTGAENVLYDFGGSAGTPNGGMIYVKGKLYGTTSFLDAGELFAYDLSTGVETLVYRFCSRKNCTDGEQPEDGLVILNGALYGTTNFGGAYNQGTIFSVDRKSGAETVLYSFTGGADGEWPGAGLIAVKGVLYGTTTYGGDHTEGTVFSFDPKTGTETALHSFGLGQDGATPEAALIDVNGTLYGTTWEGGAYNDGSVFSIDPSSGTETVLHSFDNADGQWPVAGLIDVKGTLYGTTFYGGAYTTCGDSLGCGTVFSLDPATGVETVLHSFGGTDGATPAGGLIPAKGGFYGTTSDGGTYGYGTVFVLKNH